MCHWESTAFQISVALELAAEVLRRSSADDTGNSINITNLALAGGEAACLDK